MRLILVPTPVGNLEDITLRALKVLKEAGAVAAEDTRHSRRLLSHYNIERPLVRLDQHTLDRAEGIFARYPTLAYVTDAGTPGISDPGAELVAWVLERGGVVEALPGPTAFVPALVASGLPTARFVFEGFLPKKGRERRARLDRIAAEDRTVVLYESPHRLRATLEALAERLGPEHRLAVARELTKKHEEIFRGTLAEALAHFEAPRGEFVLVLAPPGKKKAEPVNETALLERLVAEGLRGKALVQALTEAGVPRNRAYRLALEYEA